MAAGLRAAGPPLAFLAALVFLAAHVRVVRRADVVVVMEEGGFGHTVVAPDLARRIFPGEACVVVALSDYGRHNWKIASLWPDVRMFFLPMSLGLEIGGEAVTHRGFPWYRRQAPRFFQLVLRKVARKHARVLTTVEMYESILAEAGHDSVRRDLELGRAWPNVYVRLSRETPAPPARLPRRWREQVGRGLARVAATGGGFAPRGTCCLYLRQKNAEEADITGSVRAGSALEEYLEGVGLLREAGYQVLLTGDVALPQAVAERFRGTLADTKAAGVDRRIFSLYAGTEADIFMGEVGGGTWLPGVNGIRSLILNAFPYFYGFPNAWMYYKSVAGEDGRQIDPRQLFSELAYAYQIPGATVRKNGSREITSAIAAFLEDVDKEPEAATASAPRFEFPKHTWAWNANAKLSRAWVTEYWKDATQPTAIAHS